MGWLTFVTKAWQSENQIQNNISANDQLLIKSKYFIVRAFSVFSTPQAVHIWSRANAFSELRYGPGVSIGTLAKMKISISCVW